MPYGKYEEQNQIKEREKHLRWHRPDWQASVEEILFEHEYFRSEIPFSGDLRPVDLFPKTA